MLSIYINRARTFTHLANLVRQERDRYRCRLSVRSGRQRFRRFENVERRRNTRTRMARMEFSRIPRAFERLLVIVDDCCQRFTTSFGRENASVHLSRGARRVQHMTLASDVQTIRWRGFFFLFEIMRSRALGSYDVKILIETHVSSRKPPTSRAYARRAGRVGVYVYIEIRFFFFFKRVWAIISREKNEC